MGFFSSSSPFEGKVDAATDGQKEDWAKIMEVCDMAKDSSLDVKDCLSSILSRLRHQDPHIALQALTLLDACINNCGKNFHLVVASRDFETEFKKILAKSKGEVRNKLLSSLNKWAEGDFKKDSQLSLIPSLCSKLKQEGYNLSAETVKSEKPVSLPKEAEDADLAKAIELSLKETSSPKNKNSTSSGGLYPSMPFGGRSSSPDGRKVLALYDFEAVEEGELTFKAGEIITVVDEADQNWWKGHTKKSEGLFPSNFVTSDLTVETDQPKAEAKRTVQFDEEVRVQKISKEEVEINESKMDMLLHYLHEADPTDPSRDPPEMLDLADEVNAMGPLIDTELERVDSKHAKLSQLCMDLQGALNLYHTLMKETPHTVPGQGYMAKPMGYPYSQPPQLNGASPNMMQNTFMMPSGMPPPGLAGHPGHIGIQGPPGVPNINNGPPPPHFIPDSMRPPNGGQFGPGPAGGQQVPPGYHLPPMASHQLPQASYQDKPHLL